MPIALYYCRLDPPNFGDELNQVLWARLGFAPFAGVMDYDTFKRAELPTHLPLFVGIGTLLNNQLPAEREALIFGSGAGYGPPPVVSSNWTIEFVRGPMTAQALGLPADQAITDPAILVRTLEWSQEPTRSRFGFVPHVSSVAANVWPGICADLGVRYINPHDSPDRVIAQIRSCDTVICGAMHGAIIADAFRVPWIPVTYGEVNTFKWRDWCASLGLTYQPATLPTFWPPSHGSTNVLRGHAKQILARLQLRRVMRKQHSHLSSDHVMEQRSEAVLARLDRLRHHPWFSESA